MMKNLLIEEMKRAIVIMESKEEIKKTRIETSEYNGNSYTHTMTDRETTELVHLFLAIRKHSILLENGIK